MLRNTFLALLTVCPLLLFAQQEESALSGKFNDFQIRPTLGVQLWSSYTKGQEVFDQEAFRYEPVDDRLNFQIRRLRFGASGQAYRDIKFNLTWSLDFVGRDVLSATEGGSNNGASPLFRLWNAFVQWRVLPGSEHLNVVAGYLTPQIGRESITGAFRTPSMEKAWSQNYLRRHLVGTGPGRAVGINIGGLIITDHSSIGWGYDVGLFNPAFNSYNGNSAGRTFAPLFTGRLALYIGDPESNTFTLSHKATYFGKRNGLTLAVAGAYQGETDQFLSNAAAGGDFLLNLGMFSLDGEWIYLFREGSDQMNGLQQQFEVTSLSSYVRTGYTFPLNDGRYLEPTVSVIFFGGETNANGQENALAVQSFAGEDLTIDIGVNYYFNPDLKLMVHYTLRDGDAGAAEPGASFNNYFFQGGAGPIRRGDWLGLGLVAIF